VQVPPIALVPGVIDVGADEDTSTVMVKDVDAPTVRFPAEQVNVDVPEQGIDEDT
jgi:hypothetical protein